MTTKSKLITIIKGVLKLNPTLVSEPDIHRTEGGRSLNRPNFDIINKPTTKINSRLPDDGTNFESVSLNSKSDAGEQSAANSSERRHEYRVPVKIPAIVNSMPATIQNITPNGCFIKTDYQVSFDEQVQINLDTPTGNVLRLTGQVVRKDGENGFGFKFDINDSTKEYIAVLINFVRTDFDSSTEKL